MSNMSYCRYRNTLRDLIDATDNLGIPERDVGDEENADSGQAWTNRVLDEERDAIVDMAEIAANFLIKLSENIDCFNQSERARMIHDFERVFDHFECAVPQMRKEEGC